VLNTIRFYNRTPDLFGNPWVDLVRAGCVVLGMVLICWIGRAVKEQAHHGGLAPGQMFRFVGLACLVLASVYTEAVAQGSPLTWRLFLNVIGLAASFLGIRGMRREQKDHR
jgi:hypothetical protein